MDAVAKALLADPPAVSPASLTALIRLEIEAVRAGLTSGSGGTVSDRSLSPEGVADRVRERFAMLAEVHPRKVINATGVVVHTNLGRAPLSEAAVEAVRRVAEGYSDLEFDLGRGARGSRQDHVRDLLRVLTGAEDALVVNNNAAAVLLALAALAREREVVVSRGELVEIGGSFRIPDVLAASGAVLREVGTTNRTHRRDYEAAIGPRTGLLLKVHTSNYRVEGFTAEVTLEAMVALGRERGVPVAVDLGSGAMVRLDGLGVRSEPLVADVVAQGPDLVAFSGDKLLGGPQAGIVVGKRDAVERLRTHPLARAVRIDKMLLSGLQATLAAYLTPERARETVPVLRMVHEPVEAVAVRAERTAAALGDRLPGVAVAVEPGITAVGGGSLPGEGLPTRVVALTPPAGWVAKWERRLRTGVPAVLGRINEERLLLDMRTVADAEADAIPALVAEAWSVVRPSSLDAGGASPSRPNGGEAPGTDRVRSAGKGA